MRLEEVGNLPVSGKIVHRFDVGNRGVTRDFAAGSDDKVFAQVFVTFGQCSIYSFRSSVSQHFHRIDIGREHLLFSRLFSGGIGRNHVIEIDVIATERSDFG